MFNGAHMIVYSKDAEADRAFFRDVLGLAHVDVGHGWLIFALPPAELAVHPADGGGGGEHELYLMCDDLDAAIAALGAQGVACAEPEALGWGRRSRFTLPGGGAVAFYQPRHARPGTGA
jgi:catechol 2,3-dioxygenase-like lactoylglutathione lyase family enzyme